MRILFGILAAAVPGLAYAHGGNPAEAKVTSPDLLGTTADTDFVITWIDADRPIPTGTATVDLYYVEQMPPTFFLGAIPSTLTGTPIAQGIPEYDTTDELVWDTRALPSGTYWIWSRVNDPPEPIVSPIYISFSPAPINVQHAGDPIGPSIRITRPSTNISYSDDHYELRYETFAPNGPATVRLEAGTTLDGSDFTVIADGLAATSTGAFVWDTHDLPEMDWTVRAVITDDTGSFTAYCKYFLLITHFIPGRDAGVRDADPRPDAGPGLRDAAVSTSPEPSGAASGCGCSTCSRRRRSAGTPALVIGLLAAVVWSRRRGR